MYTRTAALTACLANFIVARDIVFPTLMPQVPFMPSSSDPFSAWTEIPASVAGLTTFANLPHVYCLADAANEKIEAFDIAFLGAPFDTVRARTFSHCLTSLLNCDYRSCGHLTDQLIGYNRKAGSSLRTGRDQARIEKNSTWRLQHLHG
jgi:hypothetical protein